MKRMLIFLAIMVFAAGLNSPVFAMNCGGHGSGHQAAAQAADGHSGHGDGLSAQQGSKVVYAGNKTCPVTGVEIQEKTVVTSEYDGKIYNFCCAACIDTFKKNPEKYLKDDEKKERAR